MEQRERILNLCRERFFKLGIRNVTMKDIAQDLGISKKTLYQEFENKDAIVTEITQTYLDKHACQCQEMVIDSENAIDEIITVMQHVQKTINRLTASMLQDLKKFYPAGWKALEKHRSLHVEKMLDLNLNRGKEEGLYRENINNKIIARLKTVYPEIISDTRHFPSEEYDVKELHRELLMHYLYGICTEKGHKYIDQKLNKLI